MGRQLAAAKAEHPGTSGFRLLPVGIDSFLLRMEMAEAAGRTLDVQYFVVQSDDTGQLLIEALAEAKPTAQDLDDYRGVLAAHRARMTEADAPYMRALAGGEPLAAMLNGRSALVWAKAEVIYDSPEKAKVQDGEQGGRLLRQRLGDVAGQVRSELIIVSPYLVPGPAGMKFFEALRARNVSVRILTNSLASTDMSIVHSGYQAFRVPLLTTGVDLFEVRPVLGQRVVRGSQLKSPSSGRYALQAKVFVFDRQRVFVGSMNLDQRSLYLNTEIGPIIDSPELARQIATRFADIAQPANSYVLMLSEPDGAGQRHLVWRTLEEGKAVDFQQEPAVTLWQRLQVDMLSFLPLDELL